MVECGVGIVRGDGASQLAQRSGAQQTEELGFGQHSADQGTEAPGHPRLGPLGALQDCGCIEYRRGPVRCRRFLGEFVENLQDPLAHHRGVRPLRLRRQRNDGAPMRARWLAAAPGVPLMGCPTMDGTRSLASQAFTSQSHCSCRGRTSHSNSGGWIQDDESTSSRSRPASPQSSRSTDAWLVDPEHISEPPHLADAHAPAAERGQGLFLHGVEHFAHEPQGFCDGAERRVAAQGGAGAPSIGDRR
jgi:hypothetical protein